MVALDAAGPTDVFSAATHLLERNGYANEGYSLTFSALTPGPITCDSGLVMYASTAVGLFDSDVLLVPGGPDVEALVADEDAINAVRIAATRARRIVSVCSGAFLLAACGLLDGKRATTHWATASHLAEEYPNVFVEADAIYIEDGNIFTSAGVTAGIDLALALVENDYGPALALEIARMLLLYRHRPGHQSQFSAPLAAQAKAKSRFAELITWIEEHITEDLSIAVLAEHACMSPRTFSRIFPSETGLSPGRFVERVRIDRAREFIESGMQSFDEVAQQAGFGREERLRRAFLRQLGVSPAQYRAHYITGEQYDNRTHIRNIHI